MTLPSKELIGMAHQYNKNISAWNYDKKKFRKEFWKKFLKEIHTIPTEMYATHRASAGSLDDTTYIYTTAVSKEQLTSSANISTMSNVELPNGKYLVITFEMDNILDSLTGYDDIIYTVYTKVLPKMNLLRRSGPDIERYTLEPWLNEGKLDWREGAIQSLDKDVIADINTPFSSHGGTQVMEGNLGRAVMKTSAVPDENKIIEAPAVVFNSQHDIAAKFSAGELNKDCVVVVRYQGPQANGMPELHKLMPPLGVLMDKGYKVALVTDGRLSGASGKVPAAIHVTPEAVNGGLLAKVQDGDIIRVNGKTGELTLLVDEQTLEARQTEIPDLSANNSGCGRELFVNLRRHLSGAEQGACCIDF